MSCERKPTSEELTKIENYFKEYVRLDLEVIIKSVEIPFSEFFENTNDKFHLTTVFIDNLFNAESTVHAVQTDKSFKLKRRRYDSTFLSKISDAMMKSVFHFNPLHFNQDTNDELQLIQRTIAETTFRKMNTKYCRDLNKRLKYEKSDVAIKSARYEQYCRDLEN